MDLYNLAKSTTNTVAGFLNQPVVKEGVKNIAGSITFTLGLVEIYDIYQILRGRRKISTEVYSNCPKWMQVTNKVIVVFAKFSLILSAATSRSGVIIISTLVGSIFSTSQLEGVLGPNTIFAINPRHPRHLVSIAAVVFALPAIAESTLKSVVRCYRKICQYKNELSGQSNKPWLTDAKVRLITLFNTITSRPILHIGNQLSRFVFHRA